MQYTFNTASKSQHLLVFASAIVISACASFPNQKVLNASERSALRSVAVVQATQPAKLEMINTKSPSMFFGLVGGLIEQSASDSRSAEVLGKSGDQLRASRFLTASLVEAMRSRGLTAEVLPRPQQQPIDYRGISTSAPHVLDASIERIGFMSLTGSGGYVPILQVKARLLKAGTNDVLWANQFSYGLEGPKDFFINIPADNKYRYANFDALSQRSAEAIEALNVGAQLIAKRIAELPN